MKLSYRLAAGAVALTALAGAIPATFAQSSEGTTTGDPVACAAALDARHADMLARMEEQYNARKAQMNAMHDAVQAALQLSDADARKEALKAARDAMRDAMKEHRDERQEERQDEIDSVREACGDLLPARQGGGKRFGPFGRRGGGHMMGR